MSIAPWSAAGAPPQGAFDNLTRLAVICAAIVAGFSSALAVGQAFVFRLGPTNQNEFTGLFFSPVTQGEFLSLVVVALVIQRLWLFLPLLAPGVVLCPSRAMWASIALGALATYFRKPLWLLILVLGLGVLLTLHPSPSDVERLKIWGAAWRYLTLWGNGFDSFSDLWFVKGNVGVQPQWVHNEYLQLIFEFGVFAAAPLALLTFCASRIDSPEWPILVAFLFQAAFSMPFHIIPVALIGALAIVRTATFGWLE